MTQEIEFPMRSVRQRYEAAGGKLSVSDWRRDAVNQFVKQLYSEVKKTKPKVQVGISPFGIWRRATPKVLRASTKHEGLYADASFGWKKAGSTITHRNFIGRSPRRSSRSRSCWRGGMTHNPSIGRFGPASFKSRKHAQPWLSPEEIGQSDCTHQSSARDRSDSAFSQPSVPRHTIHFSAKAIMTIVVALLTC